MLYQALINLGIWWFGNLMILFESMIFDRFDFHPDCESILDVTQTKDRYWCHILHFHFPSDQHSESLNHLTLQSFRCSKHTNLFLQFVFENRTLKLISMTILTDIWGTGHVWEVFSWVQENIFEIIGCSYKVLSVRKLCFVKSFCVSKRSCSFKNYPVLKTYITFLLY